MLEQPGLKRSWTGARPTHDTVQLNTVYVLVFVFFQFYFATSTFLQEILTTKMDSKVEFWV